MTYTSTFESVGIGNTYYNNLKPLVKFFFFLFL